MVRVEAARVRRLLQHPAARQADDTLVMEHAGMGQRYQYRGQVFQRGSRVLVVDRGTGIHELAPGFFQMLQALVEARVDRFMFEQGFESSRVALDREEMGVHPGRRTSFAHFRNGQYGSVDAYQPLLERIDFHGFSFFRTPGLAGTLEETV